MRNRIIFILSFLGLTGALLSAWLYSRPHYPQPPVFNPAANPYPRGIYANGMTESDQAEGENINIYPEVAGRVLKILAHEGDTVRQGQPIVQLDDSVQRATALQQQAEAQAAQSLLQEMRALPRPENLQVAQAQVAQAQASLKQAEDEFRRQQAIFDKHPELVSADAVDSARNAWQLAVATLKLAERQEQLVKAGAWSLDINTQQHQFEAQQAAAQSSQALLEKYTVRAPVDGKLLALSATAGSYVTAQGVYDSYTQGYTPLAVMSTPQQTMVVRCFIDEILIHSLPPLEKVHAEMTVRGTETHIPLQFLRIQPYVSPKIELSNQRQERVDVRVLPVLFRYTVPRGMTIYPGQLVDVYIAQDQRP